MFLIKKFVNNIIRLFFDTYNYIFSSRYKTANLKQTLAYCNDNIPLYSGMGNEIECYPFMDKLTVQNNIAKFPTKKILANIGSTSGTTGSPGKFHRDIENMVLWAYPAPAALLAEYCIRKNIKLNFDIIATSSEKLYEHQAKTIEDAFNVKVKDLYGQGERIAAFYRCELGHYHEIPNYSYVEYIHIKDDLYKIAGTSLHNKIMPLVRYKMNDIVKIEKKPCECGAKGKNIIEILGREDDYITTPKGICPGILFAAPFQRLRNIKETQIIQRSESKIDVLVVKNEDFNISDQRLLEETIYGIITKEVCEIIYVNKLEKDKSGKLRFIINHTIHKNT